jgi:hypothetical protein
MTRFWRKSKWYGGKKNPLFFINLFLLFAVLSFFNVSCSKYPSKVGAGLMPNNSLSMHFKQDTFRVYSKPIDTVRADELFQSFLGSLKDPVFGETDAGFYSKILPISVGHRFGAHPQTDSVILQLYYSGVYGDTNATLRVHVYEMKEDIHFDSIYYSNKKVAVYPTDYADETFHPNPNNYYLFPSGVDTIFDTVRHVIRFNLSHLSTALGDKLLNADTAILDSNELFMNYFKGLYIKVDPVPSGGALASFITNTTKSVLTVYYRNDTADSLQYSYVMNAAMARINRYTHDYTSGDADFVKEVVNGDTTLGQKQFYVQGLAGVKAIIKFPHIRDLNKRGKVGINEAKLILPGAEKPLSFKAPPALVLVKITSDTTLAHLPDEAEGPDFFGGTYNSETNSYTFRITRYIESLIKDSTIQDKGLALYVKNSSISPTRFVFNGPEYSGDSARRAQLNILYTIVK